MLVIGLISSFSSSSFALPKLPPPELMFTICAMHASSAHKLW